MRIDSIVKTSAVLAACAACLAPATATAQQPAAPEQPAGGFGFDQQAQGLDIRSTALLHRTLRVSGTLAGADAGEAVVVQRLARGGRWQTVAKTRADADGAFVARWKPNRTGVQTLRAVDTSGAAADANAASTHATGRVTVYRSAVATYYGPGFWGTETACGQKLRRETLGVAHRTLPCGTLVSIYHKGSTITVPVIDRGPFRKGVTWDLTQATADALGFTGIGTIGALVSPAAR